MKETNIKGNQKNNHPNFMLKAFLIFLYNREVFDGIWKAFLRILYNTYKIVS